MINAVLDDWRFGWKQLFLTDMAYKTITFIVLVPFTAMLFRVLVGLSGRTIVADEDIAIFFLLHPLGWAAVVFVGGLVVAILAVEQVALLRVVAAANQKKHLRVRSAIQLAARDFVPVLMLTMRLVGILLLVALPFLLFSAMVYYALLTEFDINYYLAERPPVFWLAGMVIGATVLVMLGILIWLVVSWFFALPLLVFNKTTPKEALRASRVCAIGNRLVIAKWTVSWLAVTAFVASLATSAIAWLAQLLLPQCTDSARLLVFAVGGFVLLWNVIGIVVGLFSITSFAAVMFHVFKTHCPAREPAFALDAIGDVPDHGVARLSRRWFVGILLTSSVVAAILGYLALASVNLEDQTQIAAHRGASAGAPENTLAAIELAISEGADWVEIDVQETADGEVVVMHDADFKKIAGVDLRIWDATVEDLKDIDIGSWFGKEFADQRVPTLADVLRLCKGKVGVNIELKHYGHAKQLEQRVVNIVELHGAQSNVVIMSLKYDSIQRVKALRPEWRVGLLTAIAIGNLASVDADFLAVNEGLATHNLVKSAHASGKEVHVWTINDPIKMSSMMGRGVDFIITDKPGLARAVKRQRAQLTTVERLLLKVAEVFGAPAMVMANQSGPA